MLIVMSNDQMPDAMKNQFTIEMIGDAQINVAAGQTILEASLAAGIPHYKYPKQKCRVFIK